MHWSLLGRTALLALSVLTLLPGPTRAQGEDLDCQQTAAYVANFAEYIEWPEEAFQTGFFEIVIACDAPCLEAIQHLEGSIVHGYKARIQVIKPGSMLPRCNLLWTHTDQECVPLEPIPGQLTVGAGSLFVSRGGGIALYRKAEKLLFSINLSALAEAKLKPSSKLLRLGTVVAR